MNKLIFILVTILFFSLNIFAQYVSGRVLPNGLNVVTCSEYTIDGKVITSQTDRNGSTDYAKENNISRIFFDLHNDRFYGYDLEAEKTDEIDKYKITLKPLSETMQKNIKSKYHLYTNLEYKPIITSQTIKLVNDGDTIVIIVSEIPETKTKSTDYIKVTREIKSFGNYFPERNHSSAKNFSLEDVELKLSKFNIYVNGKLVKEMAGGAGGSLIWINFPDGKAKGRFVFSIIPREGYDFQKTGNIKDYTIEFNFNGDNYQIVSSVPIISTHKNWNLWILHQPDYKPTYNGFEVGGLGGVKGLSN